MIVFLLPVIIALMFLEIYPFTNVIQTSFLKASIMNNSGDFYGFENYKHVLTNFQFWRGLSNTLVFTVVAILLTAILSFVAALLLNVKMKLKGIFRALNIIPWVAPPAMISIVWRWIYSTKYSPINDILLRLNIIEQPISFLGNINVGGGPLTLPMLSIIIIYVWISYPFLTLVFLSGLQSISEELYEAAEVDGATQRQKIFQITLPLLKPVILISLTILFIWTFQYFNISYLVTHGGPRGYTEVLATHIYAQAFEKHEYGYASAAGVIMMLILVLPSFYYIRTTIRQIREE